jgi:hypothetical protein
MRKSALLFLVAPLALAACGGSSNGLKVDPVAYVKHAALKTVNEPTEHMTLTGTVSVGPMSVKIIGSGDFSNQTHVGSMVASAIVLGHHATIDEVLDGTTIYMSSPLLFRGLPAGKKWIRLDLARFGRAKGIDYTSLLDRSPTQALQQLEAAGTVAQVGTETIDGVTTTHFRVENLDVSKLPQGSKLAALGTFKYGPIDVWIGNATGYIYRETMSFTMATGGRSASITMRIDLSKFGEAVHTVIPSAGETVDGTNAAINGAGG